MTTEQALTVIERADIALDASATEKHLRELVAKSARITEIKDRTGRDQCHRAAMELADARITIQKTGKAAREDATQFSKAVIAREKKLVEIVTPEESRLLGVRDIWDAAIEAKKAAAAAAERARVESITKRIDEFRSYADLAVLARTSAMVEKLIEQLTALPVDGMEEFQDQGMTVRVHTMKRLQEIRAAKKAEEDERERIKAEQEAEAAKLASQRAELARQQAEAAAELKSAQEAKDKADRDAAEERAAAEALAKAKRDAEAAELQRQRDAFAAEQAAARAAQQAEANRLQAQADELARQRSELEKKQPIPIVEWSHDAIKIEVCHIAESGNKIADQVVTMADPELANPSYDDPSDDEIISTAASAVANAYGLTFGQAIKRLCSVEWIADWTSLE